MSDDVARIVGAGQLEEIDINGKKCKIRPLALVELVELERECLKGFKREYLRTYSENLDLLSDSSKRDTIFLQKLELVAKWDVHDLPTKNVTNPQKIKQTVKVREWVEEFFEQKVPDGSTHEVNRMVQRLAATAFDSGALDQETYESLGGGKVIQSRVGYVNWWVTGSFDGMLNMVWSAFKPFGVTKEEVSEAVAKNPALLVNLAREVEHLSGPASGNT